MKAINNFEKLFDLTYQTSKQKEYLSFHKKRFKCIYEIICKLNPRNILDIGSSRFTYLLKKEGRNINVLNKSDCNLEIEKIPFKDNLFDLVIYGEVIEHLHTNYLGSLKEIYRILKPKGFLLFETPNSRSLRKIFGIGNINKGHIREFSMKECSMMLQKADFDIVFTKKDPIHFLYYLIVKLVPKLRESILCLGMKKEK